MTGQPRRSSGAGGAGTFRSLENRNFRLYTTGQLVSVVGTAMQQVAQSWLVLDLTDSGVALGITVALQFLPLMLFGVWGGLWADRLDKRKLLELTQVVMGALAVILFALVAADVVELWMVYALALGLGLATCVDLPVRQAFTSEMVGPDHVSNAVALNSAVFNSGRLVGPAVAGLLIASVGVGICFLINGLSYVATVVALRAMDPAALHRHPAAAREKGQIRAGLLYTWRHPVLRRTLLLMAVVGTFGFNFIVVMPLMVKEVFGGGARLYGVMSSLMGLGSMAGALLTARRTAPTRAVLIGGAAAFGLAEILAAVAPNAVTASAVMLAMGMAMMVFLATANSTLQLASDHSMRGRVMALYGLVFLGSTPVGGPIIGWISEHVGPRAGLGTGGVLSLAAAVGAAVPVLVGRRRAALEPVPGEVVLGPAPGGGIAPGEAVEVA